MSRVSLSITLTTLGLFIFTIVCVAWPNASPGYLFFAHFVLQVTFLWMVITILRERSTVKSKSRDEKIYDDVDISTHGPRISEDHPISSQGHW